MKPSPSRVAQLHLLSSGQEFDAGGSSISYDRVKVQEDSSVSVGGYADTLLGYVRFEAEASPGNKPLSRRLQVTRLYPDMPVLPGDLPPARMEIQRMINLTADKLRIESPTLPPHILLEEAGLSNTPFTILRGSYRSSIKDREFSSSRYLSGKFLNTTPPEESPNSALSKAESEAKLYGSSAWPGGMAAAEGLVYWSDSGKWSGVWSSSYSPS